MTRKTKTSTQPYMQEEWFLILQREVAHSNRSIIAEKLAYSKTAISLIMNGKYAGKTDKIKAVVLEHFTQITCPYSGNIISLQACRDFAQSKAPTHHPGKMQHWLSCQQCPNSGQCEDGKK